MRLAASTHRHNTGKNKGSAGEQHRRPRFGLLGQELSKELYRPEPKPLRSCAALYVDAHVWPSAYAKPD